jgi:hypothetical protein
MKPSMMIKRHNTVASPLGLHDASPSTFAHLKDSMPDKVQTDTFGSGTLPQQQQIQIPWNLNGPMLMAKLPRIQLQDLHRSIHCLKTTAKVRKCDHLSHGTRLGIL